MNLIFSKRGITPVYAKHKTFRHPGFSKPNRDILQKLSYSKAIGMTRKDVLTQKNGFKYPKAWELSEDKDNYYLTYKRSLMERYY